MVYQSDCCYLPYSMHFSGFMSIFTRENGQNMKIFEVRHFHMIRKWPQAVTRRPSINTFKRINSLEECLMSCRLTKMSESSISYWAVIMNNFYHGTVHCSSNIERYHYKYEKQNQNLQVQCKYWPKSFHALLSDSLQLKKNNTYQFLNWVSRKLFWCNCSMSRTK